MNKYSVKFFDDDEEEIANMPGPLNIPIFKGMEILIHGYSTPFKVATWSYIYDHESELRIILESA